MYEKCRLGVFLDSVVDGAVRAGVGMGMGFGEGLRLVVVKNWCRG